MDEQIEVFLQILPEEVRKKGFPESVLPALAEKVRENKYAPFTLPFETKIEDKPVKGQLYLIPDEYLDWFHLDAFSIDLGKDEKAVIPKSHFEVGEEYNFSLRQGYNLMQGRWVYGESSFQTLRSKGDWLAIDVGRGFFEYADIERYRGDFQLQEIIASSPLKGYLSLEQQQVLVESLKQGNRQELNLEVTGATQKVWATASPAFQKIQLTDAKGNKMELREPS